MLRFIKGVSVMATAKTLFQYISCYGLSPNKKPDSTEKDTFQYISCYGLSTSLRSNQNLLVDFNTSHVTVYRK